MTARPLATLVLALALGWAGPLRAQDPVLEMGSGNSDELVDRVVAIAGDSVVLLTQIQEQLIQRAAQGQQIPSDPEALRLLQRQVLEDLVDQLLLVQAAEQDTLVNVPADRVETALRTTWDEQVERLGGEDQLREALEQAGMTPSQYRSGLRDQIRRGLLLEQYMQRQRREARFVSVDESEVREFYERERERLGRRPATVTFEQAVVFAEPSDSARAEAREEAERILGMLREGAEFADLARRFSHDPGSRQEGGDLGWLRQGELVQEFEDVAFRMRAGQTSGVVETPFGAHIIRVERIRGPERKIHHILIAAEVTDEDVRRARERAEEIHAEVERGRSPREFGEDRPRANLPDSISMARDRLDQLPSGYASALRDAAEGAVFGPLEVPVSERETAFAVVRVLEVRDEGEYTLDDLRPQIREHLRGERFEEQLVERLRARMYVEIRLE